MIQIEVQIWACARENAAMHFERDLTVDVKYQSLLKMPSPLFTYGICISQFLSIPFDYCFFFGCGEGGGGLFLDECLLLDFFGV